MPSLRAQQEKYLPLNNVSEALANWTLVNAISDPFFIPTVIVELSTQSMKALQPIFFFFFFFGKSNLLC